MIRCGKMMVLNYEDVVECLLENGSQNCPLCRVSAVAIEGRAIELLGQGIDDHVAGTVVESHYFVGGCSGGDCCEVGDSADVLQDAIALGIGEQDKIEQGNQGRALTSGEHIGGAEVGNHRYLQLCGQDS